MQRTLKRGVWVIYLREPEYSRMVKKAVSRGKRGGCDRQRGRFWGIYCCAPHYFIYIYDLIFL